MIKHTVTNLFVAVVLFVSACSPAITITPSLTPVPSGTSTPARATSTSTVTATARTATSTSTSTATQVITPSATPDTLLRAEVDIALDLAKDKFPLAQPFIVKFNQPMDTTSSNMPLLVYPQVAGQVKWDSETTRLTFTPEQTLPAGQTLEFFLDPELKSAKGENFTTPPVWEIHTAGKPQVIYRGPKASANDDFRYPRIVLEFLQAMDKESVTQSLTITPPMPLDTLWDKDSLQIKFQQPLEPGSATTINLDSGAKDAQGVPMGVPYQWKITAPPFKAQVTVKNEKEVEVAFNYSLSAGKDNLPLELDPPLEGQWSLSYGGSALFRALSPFDSSTVYSIKFTGRLRDAKGVEMPALEPLTFIPPPPVSFIYEDNIYAIEKSISLQFSRPVDPQSVEAAFSITPPLRGKFEWKDNTLTYVFTERPDSYTPYQGTLKTTALDSKGRPLLIQPFTWEFKNYAYRYFTNNSFGLSYERVQVVDANAARSVRFSRGSESSGYMADLYRLGTDEFIRFYQKYRGMSSEYQAMDVSGLERSSRLYFKDKNSIDLPLDLPAGIYILDLWADGVRSDQIFLVLTTLSMTAKVSAGEIYTWVNDINAAGVAGLEMRLYNERSELIMTGETDENGLFRGTLPDNQEPFLVAARDPGGDTVITGFSYGWRSEQMCSYWSYYYWYENIYRCSDASRDKLYLFTDRPIYQPGQTVYYKAIVRKDRDMLYSLYPSGTAVKVELTDSRGNLVDSQERTLNSYSTLNGEFTLPGDGMLGAYTITLKINGEAVESSIDVQEYTKPEIQIKVKPDKEVYVDGDTMLMDIDASYYYGAPLVNENAKIGFINREGEEVVFSAKYAKGRGTDENGHLQAALEVNFADVSCQSTDYWWVYLTLSCKVTYKVTFTDANDLPVSVTGKVTIYRYSRDLTLDAGGWLKQTGQSFEVWGKLTDREGKPVAGEVVSLKIIDWDDETKDFGKDQQSTASDGGYRFNVTLPKSGYYKVIVRAKDDRGHTVESYDWVYVYRPHDADLSTTAFEDLIRITPDKTTYKPYETARFLVESKFSGPALLTLERGRVDRAIPVTLTAPLTEIRVVMTEADAPNTFVVINAWEKIIPKRDDTEEYWYDISDRNSLLHTAGVEIKVELLVKELSVSVTADKPVYQPKEQATFSIEVKKQDGQPVEAEVALALVDEAIYALRPDATLPIYQSFYAERGLSVTTYDSMQLERYTRSGDRGGGEDYFTSPGLLRDDFKDTAVWLPEIRTGSDGKASVQVTLPDNLTTWRVIVRAVTYGTLVGESHAFIRTNRPLVLRPVLPSHLVEKDRILLTTLVHNQDEQARTAKVSIRLEGLELEGDAAQEITLAGGAVGKVSWWAHASGVGEGKITFSADAGDGLSDAVSMPLTVKPRARLDRASYKGSMQGSLSLPFSLPYRADKRSSVQVTLARSQAGALWMGLEFLTGYPYGCVEQTMSRALPNAVVGRAMNQLGSRMPALEAEMPALIQASLQKLYGMQHYDGGWGWWYSDPSDVYQTAWVIYGLAMIRDAGYRVENQVIENGVEYLKKQLKLVDSSPYYDDSDESEVDIRTQAYALYSMAAVGRGNKTLSSELLAKADQFDAFSLAALALALKLNGQENEARQALELLNTHAQVDGQMVYWRETGEDGEYSAKTMSSSTRSTALALEALLRISPQDERIPALVSYLMAQRKGYGWGTTNETSYAIMALSDYLLLEYQGSSDVSFDIYLDGQMQASGSFEEGQDSQALTVSLAQAAAGVHQLEIRQTGSTLLYYTVDTNIYFDEEQNKADGPISVTREYLDAGKKPISSFEVGQVVIIKIKVTGPKQYFFIVEDQVPAGFDPINEQLFNAAFYDPYGGEGFEDQFFYEGHYQNKQFHKDRVSFFVQLFSGTMTFTYKARVTRCGTFFALPAEAYAMYNSEAWGRSSSDRIEVIP